jgi:hypothetical protein
MTATNINTTVTKLTVIGSNKNGDKLGYFTGVTKTAKDDTITIKGIKQLVEVLALKVDSDGAWEDHTVSGAVITCTSAATTDTITGFVVYR